MDILGKSSRYSILNSIGANVIIIRDRLRSVDIYNTLVTLDITHDLDEGLQRFNTSPDLASIDLSSVT